MPTYTFFDETTNEQWDMTLTIAEREDFLLSHPYIKQVIPDRLNIVSGVSGITHKTDDGWKEVMQKIAEHHPTSNHGQRYGDKSIKASKTQQAVEKWRKARSKDN